MNLNHKKSILILVSDNNFSYANKNSAVATYLNTLAESLEQTGYSVTKFPKVVHEEFSKEDDRKKSGLKFIVKKVVKFLFKPFFYALMVKQKSRFAHHLTYLVLQEKKRYDLILEFLTYGSDAGLRLSKTLGSKLVVIYDSPLMEQFAEMYKTLPFNKKLIFFAERDSITHADTVICYSENVERFIKSKYGIRDSIYQLPCITWKPSQANLQHQRQNIGFIGSFLKWHKVGLLVEAFEKIAANFPQVRLVLVGFGQEWHHVRNQAGRSQFSDRIDMPGFVSEEELINLKSTFLIGVMPGSNWYGSPLKLFEYAQASIAIIAPKTPVVSDLFSSNEALFIDENNPCESLVSSMRKLLTDESLRNRLTTNALAKMDGIYSKSEQLNKFNEIMAKTLVNGS